MSKFSPFTFIDSICWSKENYFDEHTESAYIPFIINRHLSLFQDTVLWANDINIHSDIPKGIQYQFLLNSIPKRKRFAKWNKKSDNDDIKLISRVYQANNQRSVEILELLTSEQLTSIRELYEPDNRADTK